MRRLRPRRLPLVPGHVHALGRRRAVQEAARRHDVGQDRPAGHADRRHAQGAAGVGRRPQVEGHKYLILSYSTGTTIYSLNHCFEHIDCNHHGV